MQKIFLSFRAKKYWTTLLRVITLVYSRTARLDQESLIRSLATERIRELFQEFVMKFSQESNNVRLTQKTKQDTQSSFLCCKFTTKKSKICS